MKKDEYAFDMFGRRYSPDYIIYGRAARDDRIARKKDQIEIIQTLVRRTPVVFLVAIGGVLRGSLRAGVILAAAYVLAVVTLTLIAKRIGKKLGEEIKQVNFEKDKTAVNVWRRD